MAQPYTIKFGPWLPDGDNLAVAFPGQYTSTPIPLTDCLNVYYTGGGYRSLPNIQNATPAALPAQCVGAFTSINGNELPAMFAAAGPYFYFLNGSTWTQAYTPLFTGSVMSACNFAQFGDNVIAQPVFGTQPAPYLYAGVADPTWAVSADVSVVNQTIGTGNGSTTTFSTAEGFLSAPIVPGSLTLSGPSNAADTDGAGMLVNTTGIGILSSSIDYDGGMISVTFASAPGVGAAIQVSYRMSGSGVPFSPSGFCMATVGQFLMVGNIWTQRIAQSIGTGNGSTHTFTTANDFLNAPVAPGSVTVVANNVVGTDNGSGSITGTGISGTIDYELGQISVTFTTAPSTGTVIGVTHSTSNLARVQWPAIGNANNWPTPLTDAAIAVQSSEEDLEQSYGPVLRIVGYPLYGLIFQRSAITRANYQGGDTVFAFNTYSRNLGLLTPGALVQVGTNVFFLSDAGWYMTDGSNVQPIGTASDDSTGIDRWFFSTVNMAALGAIRGGYDANLRQVVFSIPTGSNTKPDTLLLFNPQNGYWTRATIASEFTFSDTDGNRQRIAFFDQTHRLSYLTGTPASGYVETFDGMFIDGQLRDIVEVLPQIICTDVPTVKIGYRESLEDAVGYSAANTPDAFSRRITFDPPPAGRYLRVHATSAAASAMNGTTIFVEATSFA